MDVKQYTEAITAFEAIIDYKDSATKITECDTAILDGKYSDAMVLMQAEQYAEAITAFEALGDFKDSKDQLMECKYIEAIKLLDEGSVIEAYEALVALDGYSDSTDLADSLAEDYYKKLLGIISVGDIVNLGSYEQDNNTANGKESLEWIVLDVQDNKGLVISKYALDYKAYNNSDKATTWETCDLNAWLNGAFLSAAFSANEKNAILNENGRLLFLLTKSQYTKYLASSANRICQATEYALKQAGIEIETDFMFKTEQDVHWWLQQTGDTEIYPIPFVDVGSWDGDVSEYGYPEEERYVRPAMWINLNLLP